MSIGYLEPLVMQCLMSGPSIMADVCGKDFRFNAVISGIRKEMTPLNIENGQQKPQRTLDDQKSVMYKTFSGEILLRVRR